MLALIGSGEYLPPIEPVDRFLISQLRDHPRVVCLPTAAGTEGPERIRYWSELGSHYFSSLGVMVESLAVIDRQSANDPILADKIRAANFVYLSGGRPGYLVSTLANSLTWQAIEAVLAAGGLLAGCSAGAMAMASHLPAFPRWRKAFNLLPGAVIIPHYDEVPEGYKKVIRKLIKRQSTLIGIEASTALFHTGDRCQVVGSGGVTIWNQQGHQRYVDGQEPKILF